MSTKGLSSRYATRNRFNIVMHFGIYCVVNKMLRFLHESFSRVFFGARLETRAEFVLRGQNGLYPSRIYVWQRIGNLRIAICTP